MDLAYTYLSLRKKLGDIKNKIQTPFLTEKISQFPEHIEKDRYLNDFLILSVINDTFQSIMEFSVQECFNHFMNKNFEQWARTILPLLKVIFVELYHINRLYFIQKFFGNIDFQALSREQKQELIFRSHIESELKLSGFPHDDLMSQILKNFDLIMQNEFIHQTFWKAVFYKENESFDTIYYILLNAHSSFFIIFKEPLIFNLLKKQPEYFMGNPCIINPKYLGFVVKQINQPKIQLRLQVLQKTYHTLLEQLYTPMVSSLYMNQFFAPYKVGMFQKRRRAFEEELGVNSSLG